jgi:hypothetical protein
MEQRVISQDMLEHLLREAEAAHAEYERGLSRADENWPHWYAQYVFEHLPPGGDAQVSAEPYIAG